MWLAGFGHLPTTSLLCKVTYRVHTKKKKAKEIQQLYIYVFIIKYQNLKCTIFFCIKNFYLQYHSRYLKGINLTNNIYNPYPEIYKTGVKKIIGYQMNGKMSQVCGRTSVLIINSLNSYVDWAQFYSKYV